MSSDNDRVLRFVSGVQVAEGDNDTYILYSELIRIPLQLGSSFSLMLGPLARGASLSELVEIYEKNFSSTGIEAVVSSLVEKLKNGGYIQFDNQVHGIIPREEQMIIPKKECRGTWYWSGLDSFLDNSLRYLPSVSLRLEKLLIPLIICISILVTIINISSEFEYIKGKFTLEGINALHMMLALVIIYCVIVPLHELGHAIATKTAGVRVSGFGMFMKWYIFPAFFVESRGVLGIKSNYKKILIPMAGFIMDAFVLMLVSQFILLLPEGGVFKSILCYVLCIGIFVAINNLNPVIHSDGARALCAIYNDYALLNGAFRGRKSIYSSAKNILMYRVVAWTYIVIIFLFWVWLLRM